MTEFLLTMRPNRDINRSSNASHNNYQASLEATQNIESTQKIQSSIILDTGNFISYFREVTDY